MYLGLAFGIERTYASGTITIRSDGLVDPPWAPINHNGSLYTFTNNINESIVVERSNIVIDGAGYTVEGSGLTGISLTYLSNVTIKNMAIRAFGYGIYLISSSNNSISGNHVTATNWVGIRLDSSSNNSVSGNNITANRWYGILLDYSSNYNSISGNHVTNNGYGIVLGFSANYNSISENNVTESDYGVWLESSSNFNVIFGNKVSNNNLYGIYLQQSSRNLILENDLSNNGWGLYVYDDANWNDITGNSITTNSHYGTMLLFSSNNSLCHNNFIDNVNNVYSYGSTNSWDNGLEGNYWSNYSGTDSNNDGIGDTRHTVNATEIDHFPLAGMFHAFSTPYGCWVGIISNSSISSFSFNLTNASHASLSFNVTGTTATEGFFRICIPKALIGDLYVVKLNGTIITAPQARELPCSNETYEYLYVNYTHSQQSIEITGTTTIAEFPIFLILSLFMLATLAVLIVWKKKRLMLS